MKNYLLALCIIFSGCTSKIIPIQNTYLTRPYEITSNKSFEEVWSKLIDLFIQKGISIKIIDKSSGIIISDRTKFSYTIETKENKLKNPDAFIVVGKFYDYSLKAYYPFWGTYWGNVTGEWNVRVKTVDNTTHININIVNLKYLDPFDKYAISRELSQGYYSSTGNFEKIVSDLIK